MPPVKEKSLVFMTGRGQLFAVIFSKDLLFILIWKIYGFRDAGHFFGGGELYSVFGYRYENFLNLIFGQKSEKQNKTIYHKSSAWATGEFFRASAQAISFLLLKRKIFKTWKITHFFFTEKKTWFFA